MTYPSFSVGETLTSASMNAVGLWKISTTSLSGSGANIADAFPTDYLRFRILITGIGTQATATSFYLQLRTAGGSTANTSYSQNVVYESATAGPLRVYTGNNAQWEVGGASDLRSLIVVDLYNVNRAGISIAQARGTSWGNSASFFSKHDLIHTPANAYTGLAWSVAAGTFSGELTVYGYRD